MSEEKEKEEETIVLCGASSYEQKYYLNEEFSNLPEDIRQELQIMCVMYTEDVGGVLTLEYEQDGTLIFRSAADEADYLYDEVGSALKIQQIREEKRDLLESLELYYRIFFLGEDVPEDLNLEDDPADEEDLDDDFDEDDDDEDDETGYRYGDDDPDEDYWG